MGGDTGGWAPKKRIVSGLFCGLCFGGGMKSEFLWGSFLGRVEHRAFFRVYLRWTEPRNIF